MATCFECNAVYMQGITVCPACNRPMEEEVPVVLEGRLVTIMTGWQGEIYAARAALEAAGVETDIVGDQPILLMGHQISIQIRESDLDAAKAVLRSK